MARLVSHPTIDFGSGRRAGYHRYLGLARDRTTYHVAPAATRARIGALRSHTSRFRFPPVGRLTRLPERRAVPPFGLPRARRG